MEPLQIGAAATWVDVVTLVVLTIFLVYGVLRGFMLQVLGISVLVGSALLATFLSSFLGRWLEQRSHFPQPETPRYIAFGAIFFLTLLTGMFGARRLKRYLDKAKALAYDRLLGGVLGLVKGLLLIVVCVNLLGWFVVPPEQKAADGFAASVLESQTMGLSKWSTDKILKFFPESMKSWLHERSILRLRPEGEGDGEDPKGGGKSAPPKGVTEGSKPPPREKMPDPPIR